MQDTFPQIITDILKLPQIHQLAQDLVPRTAGQKGYSKLLLIGIKLVRVLHNDTSYDAALSRISQSRQLQTAIGCGKHATIPSLWAMYRFDRLLTHYETDLIETARAIQTSIKASRPEYGQAMAVDSTDIPAWANGRVAEEKRADADATWGRRSGNSTRASGSIYGYKAHVVACSNTELPLIWNTAPADEGDSPHGIELFDRVINEGYLPAALTADTIYDSKTLYERCGEQSVACFTPLKQSKQQDFPFVCFHGGWIRVGSCRAKMAVKYACPKRKCKRKYRWFKADRQHPFYKRDGYRWRKHYARRTSIERLFSRSKRQYGLDQLRRQGLDNATSHVSFIMLTQLALGLINCANPCAKS
jgi:hypothetical protein